MRYDRECLYEVRWQSIRMSLLGSWDTDRNVTACLQHLHTYYNEPFCIDRAERAERISNYLSAILLGYGNKPEFEVQRQRVRDAQRYFSTLRTGLWCREAWDWQQVEHDLRTADLKFLKGLKLNLHGRIKTSTKRTGGTQFRPELMKFWGLLNNELTSRGTS